MARNRAGDTHLDALVSVVDFGVYEFY
ncbi:hypothetical protein CCACVL1_15005 [Corchorus capsularis]|uniref:Uncharacterized protein n=1 Tax=Corchorus capsularis TaxID=210143 RepID=A0A1R3I4D1_COCAP|nr:hypothetical protein CCACVL1_15005 [Corchorus capsularis]